MELLKKMADTLTVEGEGRKKFVCLCNSIHRPYEIGPSAPVSKNIKRVHENAEIVSSFNTVGSSDELSDDENVVDAQDVKPRN